MHHFLTRIFPYCSRGLSLNWLGSKLAGFHWQQPHVDFNQVKPVPTHLFPIETCVWVCVFENVKKTNYSLSDLSGRQK